MHIKSESVSDYLFIFVTIYTKRQKFCIAMTGSICSACKPKILYITQTRHLKVSSVMALCSQFLHQHFFLWLRFHSENPQACHVISAARLKVSSPPHIQELLKLLSLILCSYSGLSQEFVKCIANVKKNLQLRFQMK